MRANVPTDNDFSSTLPPDEDNRGVTKDQIELARIGNSPNWEIVKAYLETRITSYKNGLFGEDLTGMDSSIIGQRFLAAQSVIQEFESLRDEIERTTKTVNEVITDEQKTADTPE